MRERCLSLLCLFLMTITTSKLCEKEGGSGKREKGMRRLRK